MSTTFQTVHTMDDYYDGPRYGVADFEGKPHYYRSIYLDTATWNADEDRFELSPITHDVFAACQECAAIFERWDAVRRATSGFTYADEEYGALPSERARYQELQRFLESSFVAAAQAHRFLVHGEFRVCLSLPSRYEVQWRLVDNGRVIS